MKRKDIHTSVTEDRVIEACERRETTLDNPGICLACGADHDECEPDARNYRCEECDQPQVFDSDEILLSGYYHIPKKP